MTKRSIPLQTISVAAPCSADWGKMVGNDQVRFCQECKLNVYNLSSMTQYQAEDLIRKTEGRLCVRYFRRTDGTILTQNCPTGLQALKKKAARAATAIISALLSFITGFGLFSYITNKKETPTPLMGSIAYTPPVIEHGNEIKGEMVVASPDINTNIPPDELSNPSSCSVENPEGEIGEVLMGKIAAPVKEGTVEMGDVAVSTSISRSEKDLRSAAIESPTVEISNKEFQGKSFTVIVRIEIDSSGNVVSVEDVSSNSIDREIVESVLDKAYQWKFNVNKLNSNGSNVVGDLTFHIKN